jgi:phage-related protein
MNFNPVKTHPIHDSLKRLLALQKSAILSVASDELPDQQNWYLDRIFYLAHRANDQTKKRISLAINLNALNNLQASSENIVNELNNYISNRNPAHIDAAFNQAEQGFQIYLQQAFPTEGKTDGTEADAALASLKAASQAAISEIQSSKTALISEITALSSSVSTNLASITALNADIETHKSQSAQEIENIKSSYASLSQEFGAKFSKMNDKWDEDKAEKISQIDTDIEELVAKRSEKETEARNLVQSVGEVLITGTYQKTAADEAKLANNFRWITIALFTTGILIVLSNYIAHIYAAFEEVSYDETPWTIAARFLTALVVSLPAFYTARESARHRTNADKARQRELELSTLGPFIELLPVEIKTQIRDRLTDRYFGSSVETHTFEPPINGDNVAKLAETIAKLIKPA